MILLQNERRAVFIGCKCFEYWKDWNGFRLKMICVDMKTYLTTILYWRFIKSWSRCKLLSSVDLSHHQILSFWSSWWTWQCNYLCNRLHWFGGFEIIVKCRREQIWNKVLKLELFWNQTNRFGHVIPCVLKWVLFVRKWH
jgi:hypothetical protein